MYVCVLNTQFTLFTCILVCKCVFLGKPKTYLEIVKLSPTCQIKVMEAGTAGHQVQEAAVGHAGTVLHLQLAQLTGAPGQQAQAPVGQPGRAVEHDAAQRAQARVAGQHLQDRLDGPVGVQVGRRRQAQRRPQVRLPGEKVQLFAGARHVDNVEGGEVGHDLDQQVVGQAVQVACRPAAGRPGGFDRRSAALGGFLGARRGEGGGGGVATTAAGGSDVPHRGGAVHAF